MGCNNIDETRSGSVPERVYFAEKGNAYVPLAP